ncbi:MAG: CBS domain-containing protein [Gemmatimonadetes bacterium]|nr:CBS domain-containing protein [Gemmatimonadota bacterium]
MNLRDLLAPERIVIPLPAKTLHDAAEQLIGSFVETGQASDASKLVALVNETPAEEAVKVGGEAFILQVRSASVDSVSAALGVAPEPMRLEQESDQSARIVVLVAAPQKETSTVLQAVTAFARVLSQQEVSDAVLASESADDVQNIPELMKVELPSSVFVGDVMRRRPRFVHPETTLAEAARVMTRHHLRSIPVATDDGEVLGMVRNQDLLRRALPHYLKQVSGSEPQSDEVENAGESFDPASVPVRDVMDRSVLCVSEDQTLADVASLMVDKDSDQFPVVREGVLVGMLSRGGIVRLLFGP